MQLFVRLMRPDSKSSIVDVGGSTFNWKYVPEKPQVVILNTLAPSEAYDMTQFKFQIGDGRSLPFQTAEFDIAYSNSVIEHVGDFEDQRTFADELVRVGKKYWLQTPAFIFPIETHFLAFFIHWLPKPWQSKFLPFLSIRYWLDPELRARPEESTESIRLLNYHELAQLFRDAEIRTEYFLFFPKSYIVYGVSKK